MEDEDVFRPGDMGQTGVELLRLQCQNAPSIIYDRADLELDAEVAEQEESEQPSTAILALEKSKPLIDSRRLYVPCHPAHFPDTRLAVNIQVYLCSGAGETTDYVAGEHGKTGVDARGRNRILGERNFTIIHLESMPEVRMRHDVDVCA